MTPTLEPPPKRFFQRTIRTWHLRAADGRRRTVKASLSNPRDTWLHLVPRPGEVVIAVTLSCGDRLDLARPKPPGSRRTAAPCRACGSGPRKENQPPAFAEVTLREAIERACRDATLFPHLHDALAEALKVRALAPKTAEQEQGFERLDTHLRNAGLILGNDVEPESFRCPECERKDCICDEAWASPKGDSAP